MYTFTTDVECHYKQHEGDTGENEIIVVNIQKFEEDHEKVVFDGAYNTRLQRVFFIDEAHRGYDPKGSFLANLLEADKDAVKIAMTGTPLLREERASWKVFGDYIDTYYYDKSIADGYTLKLMREDIETSYKEKISLLRKEQSTLNDYATINEANQNVGRVMSWNDN